MFVKIRYHRWFNSLVIEKSMLGMGFEELDTLNRGMFLNRVLCRRTSARIDVLFEIAHSE